MALSNSQLMYNELVPSTLNASDHATKPFSQIFPDSEVAMKFACGHTKTAAIIKEALAPHYCDQMLENLNKNCHFSLMLDESNGKKDKPCILFLLGPLILI